MSSRLPPITLPGPPLKRNIKRIPLACTNCRKRKIRCETNDDIPPQPCKRCIKNNLICQYLPVSADPDAAPHTQWDASLSHMTGIEYPVQPQHGQDPSSVAQYSRTSFSPNYQYSVPEDRQRQPYGYDYLQQNAQASIPTRSYVPQYNGQPAGQQYMQQPVYTGNPQPPSSWSTNRNLFTDQMPSSFPQQGPNAVYYTQGYPCTCSRTPCVCHTRRH